MICNAKLSNSSLVPAKLREHFLNIHADGPYKNTIYIICYNISFRAILYDTAGHEKEEKEQTLL